MTEFKHVPTAREIMTPGLITTRRETPIFEAIGELLKQRISGMPVVDDEGRIVGMLSEVDCLKVGASGEVYSDDHSEEGVVADYMTPAGQTVGPDLDIYALAQYFRTQPVRRLPIVDGSRLLGQVSRRDVLKAIDEMGRKRVPRKHYPDYREPGSGAQRRDCA